MMVPPIVFCPVLVPPSASVRLPLPEYDAEPVLLNTTAPVPDELMKLTPVESVNRRSVVSPLPV